MTLPPHGGIYNNLLFKLRCRDGRRPAVAFIDYKDKVLSPEIEEVFQSLIDARYNDVVEGELENARIVIGTILQRIGALP